MGKIWYMYVQSVQVKLLISVNIAEKIECADPVRRSRGTKNSGHDKNRAGGGPLLLQVFFRSNTTFTSALLLSSVCMFYPYIGVVALLDKVPVPPRLNVAELSLFDPSHTSWQCWTTFMTCPCFTCLSWGFVGGERGEEYTFSGFGDTNCGYKQNFTDLTYFPLLHGHTSTVRQCFQFSAWWLLTIKQDPLFFAGVLTNKIPGNEMIAPAKYQTGTIGNNGVRLVSIMLRVLLVSFCTPFFMVAYAEKRLYARCYSHFLWLCSHLCSLFMVEYGNYARGCAHFFFLFAVLHSICDFFVYGPVSALYLLFRSRSLISQQSCVAWTFSFYNVARHHTEYCHGDRRFFAPCAEACGLHPVWKRK